MKGACLDPTLSTRGTLVYPSSHLSSQYHRVARIPSLAVSASPQVAIGFAGLQQFSLGQSSRPTKASTTVSEILCNRLTPTIAPKARLGQVEDFLVLGSPCRPTFPAWGGVGSRSLNSSEKPYFPRLYGRANST